MTTLNKLEYIVQKWAEEKRIFAKATTKTQVEKTMEEAQELYDAVQLEDKQEIKDGIGDVIVTLCILAKMEGFDLQECLEHVLYHNDSPLLKRTSKMIDGLFVKDA